VLTVGSLFSGIGGFDLGLERAGMRVIWQSEIDPYASAVLRKHWPGVPNLGDIRTIRGAEWPDVICGGFPCIDISSAGNRAGIDGPESGLWREFARVVGEIRPRFVIVENVATLLVRGLGRILGDLAAFGFDAEWYCVPASAVGANHSRDRTFIVANADGGRCEFKRLEEYAGQQGERWDFIDGCCANGRGNGTQILFNALRRRLKDCCAESECGKPGQASAAGVRSWRVEPDLGRMAHGVPRRVDRIKCLGNAIVPQIAEVIGRAIIESESVK
jgi:DNA (cytosine-5)-methyltransferase 1